MPLALVEIGASAGLNLLWDKYGYTYDSLGHFGRPDYPVQIRCSLIGRKVPLIPSDLPFVQLRSGIDIHPISITDPEEVRWLRALIWPEHTDRAVLLANAVTIARLDPPVVMAGNAADVLLPSVETVPNNTALCFFHSYTLNQCPEHNRNRILRNVEEIAETRDVFRVSLEWYDGQQQPHLELYSYTGGQVKRELLAYCESHGRSLEWLSD